MPRGRTPRPITDAMVIGALKMIEAHIGKPCPTRPEMMAWTGVPRRKLWTFFDELHERGIVDVEIEAKPRKEIAPRRRLRIVGRPWTDWTARTAHAGA